MMRGERAIRKLLDDFQFSSVLDVGAGQGEQALAFAQAEKDVVALDPGVSVYYRAGRKEHERIQWVNMVFPCSVNDRYDVVWCCHVLEHQRNVGHFLYDLGGVAKPNGWLAITVPVRKDMLVGGHLTLWTPGLLVYNLVANGFDCSGALVYYDSTEISVIVDNTRDLGLVLDERDAGDLKKNLDAFPRSWRGLIVQAGEYEIYDGMTLPEVWP